MHPYGAIGVMRHEKMTTAASAPRSNTGYHSSRLAGAVSNASIK